MAGELEREDRDLATLRGKIEPSSEKKEIAFPRPEGNRLGRRKKRWLSGRYKEVGGQQAGRTMTVTHYCGKKNKTARGGVASALLRRIGQVQEELCP